MTLLQIDFPSPGPWENELTNACNDLAHHLSETPGMIWKIWTENSQTGDIGGIYLFADAQSASSFLNEHMVRLQSMGFQNVRAKLFNVNEGLSRITRAPIHSTSEAAAD